MTYAPPMRLLQGLTVSQARKYGAPCLGARYAGRGVRTNRLEDGARCAVCGRPAANSHHEPAVGIGGGRAVLDLHGRRLRPALVALCGSGTTGCHGRVHRGLIRLEWEFDSDELEELWWKGWFDPEVDGTDAMWRIGHWAVYGRDGELLKAIRWRGL